MILPLDIFFKLLYYCGSSLPSKRKGLPVDINENLPERPKRTPEEVFAFLVKEAAAAGYTLERVPRDAPRRHGKAAFYQSRGMVRGSLCSIRYVTSAVRHSSRTQQSFSNLNLKAGRSIGYQALIVVTEFTDCPITVYVIPASHLKGRDWLAIPTKELPCNNPSNKDRFPWPKYKNGWRRI